MLPLSTQHVALLLKLSLSGIGSVAYLILSKKRDSSFTSSTQESPGDRTVVTKRSMRFWDSHRPTFAQGGRNKSLLQIPLGQLCARCLTERPCSISIDRDREGIASWTQTSQNHSWYCKDPS